MKRLELESFGVPSDVVACKVTRDPGDPGPGQVAIDVLAGPINPAELLIIEGRYASRPPLPARLGIEAVGRVAAVGPDVAGLAPGDLVISLGRENWAQRLVLDAAQVLPVAGTDVLQLAMLKVNPATAALMLDDYVTLGAGDWVIQNAANSAVGRALIQLCSQRGVHTVNVVRREDVIPALQADGADVVVLDAEDLESRVLAATGGARAALAIDAVAGSATRRLASCLADGATVVNYGLLSGSPCELEAEQAVFRGITLTGFWLAKRMQSMSRADLEALYGTLAGQVATGVVHVPVDSTFGLEDVRPALARAAASGRHGKVLFTPNGPV